MCDISYHLIRVGRISTYASDSKITSLSSRLVEPNQAPSRRHYDSEDDDDAIFAELEAEIENDDNIAMRERGLEIIKRECGALPLT